MYEKPRTTKKLFQYYNTGLIISASFWIATWSVFRGTFPAALWKLLILLFLSITIRQLDHPRHFLHKGGIWLRLSLFLNITVNPYIYIYSQTKKKSETSGNRSLNYRQKSQMCKRVKRQLTLCPVTEVTSNIRFNCTTEPETHHQLSAKKETGNCIRYEVQLLNA